MARSTGSNGRSATDVFMADIDGDKSADAIAFFETDGAWWVSRSLGGRLELPASSAATTASARRPA